MGSQVQEATKFKIGDEVIIMDGGGMANFYTGDRATVTQLEAGSNGMLLHLCRKDTNGKILTGKRYSYRVKLYQTDWD